MINIIHIFFLFSFISTILTFGESITFYPRANMYSGWRTNKPDIYLGWTWHQYYDQRNAFVRLREHATYNDNGILYRARSFDTFHSIVQVTDTQNAKMILEFSSASSENLLQSRVKAYPADFPHPLIHYYRDVVSFIPYFSFDSSSCSFLIEPRHLDPFSYGFIICSEEKDSTDKNTIWLFSSLNTFDSSNIADFHKKSGPRPWPNPVPFRYHCGITTTPFQASPIAKQSFGLFGDINPMVNQTRPNCNLLALEKTAHLSFTWDISLQKFDIPESFESLEDLMDFVNSGNVEAIDDIARQLIEEQPDFEHSLALRKTAFDNNFADVFPIHFQSLPQLEYYEFGKQLLSNLFSGLSVFHGDRQVLDPETGVLETITDSSLVTMTPSKFGFPRGFFWDEGFHSLILHWFNPSLFMKIWESWFHLQDNETGWIAREQIIGSESRLAAPSWAWPGLKNQMNPPSPFLALKQFAQNVQKEEEKLVSYIVNGNIDVGELDDGSIGLDTRSPDAPEFDSDPLSSDFHVPHSDFTITDIDADRTSTPSSEVLHIHLESVEKSLRNIQNVLDNLGKNVQKIWLSKLTKLKNLKDRLSRYLSHKELPDPVYIQQSKAFLKGIWPKLLKTFYWYVRTQRADNIRSKLVLQWSGRENDHALDSGLDDWPRFPHPSEWEGNVDLQAWAISMADSLIFIGNTLGEPVEPIESMREVLLEGLDLMWDPSRKVYSDVLFDSSIDDGNTPTKRLFNPNIGFPNVMPFCLQVISPNDTFLLENLVFRLENDLLDTGISYYSGTDRASGKKTSSPGGAVLLSLSRDSPGFRESGLYWKGGIWVNQNYVCAQALDYYSKTVTDDSLVSRMSSLLKRLEWGVVDMVYANYDLFGSLREDGMIYEMFHPTPGHAVIDGKGAVNRGAMHAPFSGWSNLALLMMNRMY